MIVCACVDMCLCVLFVMYCVLLSVFVLLCLCACVSVFVLFVIYCAMLHGLGVADCMFSVRVCVLSVCAPFKTYWVVLYVCLNYCLTWRLLKRE